MADSVILVTGGAGFIGSNFIEYVLKRDRKVNVINLDKLTYAGNLSNLKHVENKKRYKFIRGDISDKKLVNKILEQTKVDAVINFAAESHVDRSIISPDSFVKTNVTGTHVLLEGARKYRIKKFIQVSTDEVYGSISKGKSVETQALLPNSPYSASKASADLLCRSYYKTYGIPVIITRSSNNYGPRQFPEKLIPLMIDNIVEGKPLPVYSDGKNQRDWIYVEDNCEAVYEVSKKGRAGEIYNIGTGKTTTNISIVKRICNIVSEKTGRNPKDTLSLIRFVKDRPGHDFRYCLDTTKLTREIGWKPKTDIGSGLDKTVDWYLSNGEWINSVKDRSYRNYYRLNYGNR